MADDNTCSPFRHRSPPLASSPPFPRSPVSPRPRVPVSPCYHPAAMLILSRFLQLLATGLFTGLLLGDRLGVTPIRPKLPASSFVLYQQQLHITFAKLMPILLLTSLLSGIISLVLLRRIYRSKEFLLTAIATLCVLAVIVMTRMVNVPINEALMTWQVSTPPPNAMDLWAPWEKTHTIRTIVSVIGFSSLILAAITSPQRPDKTAFQGGYQS